MLHRPSATCVGKLRNHPRFGTVSVRRRPSATCASGARPSSLAANQSEDCLFLNIWTPSGAIPESKLPVLFWIHGGAFIQGSGGQPRYDGTELAKRGVVVISINYRLGRSVYLPHPALTAESKPDEPLGNYCLLDMIAALRWTRDNVAGFWWRPGDVTISGSSAGGTSCPVLDGNFAGRGAVPQSDHPTAVAAYKTCKPSPKRKQQVYV